MFAKIIPTGVHGVLDYVTGLLFLILPRFLGWDQASTWILSILGVSIIVYSLLTRYKLGLIKVIPMSTHLTLDILSGLVLIVVPFLFLDVGVDVTTWYLIFGLLEVGAGVLTKPHAPPVHTNAAEKKAASGGKSYGTPPERR